MLVKIDCDKRRKERGSDEWDNIATVDFYQRDYSYDGSWSVSDGEAYGSGWWFATIAERNRFVEWARGRGAKIVCARASDQKADR